jgi:predicted transcriptional regulator
VNADGGPFNTSLDPVMAYFERMEEDLLPVDKIETIRECIKEFKYEREILGGPIVEKKYIVPSQD